MGPPIKYGFFSNLFRTSKNTTIQKDIDKYPYIYMLPIWPPQLFNHRPFSSTQDGISPLMVATANNRSHCVKILLAEGSVPNLKSNVSM